MAQFCVTLVVVITHQIKTFFFKLTLKQINYQVLGTFYWWDVTARIKLTKNNFRFHFVARTKLRRQGSMSRESVT